MLVYVDDLGALQGVLDDIVQFASEERVRLTFAGVVEPVSWWAGSRGQLSAEECASVLVKDLEKGIAEAVSSLRTHGVEVESRVLTGDPTKVLLQEIAREGYDVLVKASQATAGGPLASIDQRLLRYVPCPVTILRPRRADGSGRIIAALDFDPDDPDKNAALNDEILDTAVRASASGFGEITVLHAWQLFGESTLQGGFARVSEERLGELLEAERKLHADWLDNYVKNYFGKLGPEATEFLKPRIQLIKGRARNAIPEQVEALKADLLILGSVGRAGAAGFFMGNTAEAVVTQVGCSILVVKPPGFEAPAQV